MLKVLDIFRKIFKFIYGEKFTCIISLIVYRILTRITKVFLLILKKISAFYIETKPI